MINKVLGFYLKLYADDTFSNLLFHLQFSGLPPLGHATDKAIRIIVAYQRNMDPAMPALRSRACQALGNLVEIDTPMRRSLA